MRSNVLDLDQIIDPRASMPTTVAMSTLRDALHVLSEEHDHVLSLLQQIQDTSLAEERLHLGIEAISTLVRHSVAGIPQYDTLGVLILLASANTMRRLFRVK